jgi:GNAT superfamily N-acetyltransferase
MRAFVLLSLSARYEDPATTQSEIATQLAVDGASGAVALSGARLVGHLLGAPKPGANWGPNVWVEAAGHAADEAETLRDLYGFAAERWVAEGRTAHFALTPAHDAALVDAWSRVGFGKQHIHAIREATQPGGGAQVKVRRAARDDIPALAALEVVLDQHQTASPVFASVVGFPTVEESKAEWDADFDDLDYAVFVAEHDGAVVGSAVGCSIEKSNAHTGLARPDSAGFLGFAAVYPEHRGLGMGRALGEAVISWSEESGYPAIVTDWRVTNLLSSRAWPALGFHETFIRMHRLVGY